MKTTNSITMRILAILTAMATISSLLVATPSTSALSVEQEHVNMEWYGPTYNWTHDTYVVDRYDAGQERLRHALGGEELRRMGYLAVTTNVADLFLFNMDEKRVYDTGFTLPVTRWCNGCHGSSGMGGVGVVTMAHDKIVVHQDGDFYLLDPVTHNAELWLTADQRNAAAAADFPVGIDGGLYMKYHTYDERGISTYRIDAPNVLVENTSVDATLDLTSPDWPGDTMAPYFQMTDYIGGYSSMLVGQIDTGVYISTSSGFGVSKIGYTDTIARRNGDNVTLKEPRLLDRLHVAWIGVDNALYVATLSQINRNLFTGVLDTPRGIPFKAETSPEVYYFDLYFTAGYSGVAGYYNFENEEDYYDAMNTDHFRDVLWLPDHAVDHQDLQQKIAEHNEWSAGYGKTFRDHIYNSHR